MRIEAILSLKLDQTGPDKTDRLLECPKQETGHLRLSGLISEREFATFSSHLV